MNFNRRTLRSRILAAALAAVLAVPAYAQPLSADAAVPNDNYENDTKNVLWETSFEDDESAVEDFVESYEEEERPSSNVRDTMPTNITGDVTSKVDLTSIDGSANYNTTEIKSNLFDSSSSTKWYTRANVPSESNPIWVSFKMKEEYTIRVYALTSANDSESRDPADWSFYGSEDGETWVLLDSQEDQDFEERYEQHIYEIDNETPYLYYKLEITANSGASDTQLADLSLGTGVESEISYGMTTVIGTGPASTWNQTANVGWTGSYAMEASGAQMDENAYASNVIADNLNVTIDEDTYLSYVLFPAMGDTYDYDYTQMYMAIDLKFQDGTYLSELAALDQNENLLNARAQGESRVLTTNQWNQVYSNIGEVAAGKTVEKVLVVFDKDTMGDLELEEFTTYFDDIELYTKQDTTYEHLSDYVYILRGTNDNASFSRGLTIPAVTAPHGFNFWVPCTNYNDGNMYDYQDTEIKYFSISHEPSYWVGDRGTWQFMINTSLDETATGFSSNSVGSDFSHDNEVAKAHYYSVEFDKDSGNAKGSKFEMTATDHAAVIRATFDEDTENRNFLFDCVRASGGFEFSEDGQSFIAYSDHTSNGSKRMYIYGEFSEVPIYTTVSNRQGIAGFEGTEVVLKIATSYISADQAKYNLELEVGDKSFDEVMTEAQETWDETLGVICDVEGATEEELISLYSNLYRLNMYPNNMSENIGTNEDPEWVYKSPYRDDDADPVSGKIYINNGFWDTYRTEWSAYALLTPNAETEYLNGLVQHYIDQSWVPRWIAPGGTNSMVGTSSDVIFADALSKGIEFDYENAYASALRNAASVSSNLTNGGRKNLVTSIFAGYTAGTDQNFSWSMEGYINDYGIAQMAKILAENETDADKKADYESEYEYYINRAQNYTLLFYDGGDDIDDKWLRGKESNGSWTTGNNTDGEYDPVRWSSDYTETNGYVMSVAVPQDAQGLANLYGGLDQLAEKLDSILNDYTPYSGYGAEDGVGGIHEQLEAREVKMGQYQHNNQPSHAILYMYNYAGQPWKTQEYVRDVLDRCYTGSTFGQGYIGDEDNGEMSAWYILSALGFYPETVGSDEWVIGSPLFDSVTIKRDDGKEIKIVANNNSKENVYIQSMTVDGEEYTKNYIKHEDLINSTEIVFNMGSEPNTEWGSGEDDLPTSITEGDEVPVVSKDITGSAIVEASVEDVTTDAVEEDTIYADIEDLSALVDDTSATEAELNEGTTTIVYAATQDKLVEQVTLTSGAEEGTAPTSMTVYGAAENGEWTEIVQYDNIEFEWTQYTRPFSLNAEEAYSFYKIELTGGTSLAQIELITETDIAEELAALIKKASSMYENMDDTYDELKELLAAALENAETVAADEEATTSDLQDAYDTLYAIISRIQNVRSAHERIEAEEYSDAHSYIVNDGENIGGVQRNTWTMYQDIEFEGHVEYFEIYYSAQSSDAGGYVEVYLDDMEDENQLLCTVQVPKTGTWSSYVLVSTDEINNSIVTAGLHEVYLVFKNNTGDAYVSNVDWFRFELFGGEDVKEEIEAIGEVTLDSEEAIEQARSDYDALSSGQQELVTNYWKLIVAEYTLMSLQTAATNQTAADEVIDLIDAIGEVTLDSAEVIDAARTAYDALTGTQKDLVTNYQTLTDAETKLAEQAANQAAADEVIKAIEAIGDVTLESGEAIETARSAYDALTDTQKALVTNYDTLTGAETKLAELEAAQAAEEAEQAANQAAADTVIRLIDEIGDVTLASEDALSIIREEYDALTDDQKALVANYGTLTDAETELAALLQEKAAADEAAAARVIELIDSIEISMSAESYISAVRASYEILTDDQQALVTNYQDLVDAEAALADLIEANTTAAEAVMELIDAIGDVTLDSAEAIETARDAYEALTDDQKALVTNLDVLAVAEVTYAELADADAAEVVETMIDQLGEASLETENEIAAARSAYEALTNAQKALVGNLETLESAESALEALKADQAAAESVEELIAALTLTDDEQAAAAREAYDALTDEQKALVGNIELLVSVENSLASQGDQTDQTDQTGQTDQTMSAVQIAQPKICSVKSSATKKSTGRVKISFEKPADGQAVEVYRTVGTAEKLIGTSTGSYVYDASPVSGKTASYYIKVVSKDTTKYTDSEASDPVSIKIPANTKKVTVKASSGKKITVSWKKVKGAKKYYIYRSTNKKSGYVRVATVKASKLYFTDTKVKAGRKYYYKIVTRSSSGYSAGKASKAVKAKK